MHDRLFNFDGYNDLEPEETITPTSDPVRALYSGDISNSIQGKAAEVYIRDSFDRGPFERADYFLVRSNERQYRLYIGDISSAGVIGADGAILYTYNATGTGYTYDWQWSRSTVSSGSVDLAGYSGYIYSSYSDYQPLPGVQEGISSNIVAWCAVGLLFLSSIALLGLLIRGWFRNGKEKEHR